ncbi:hypothetical protein LCM4573_02115 [Rhizobium sp. LCM 4573]|nr:hypothetical protein LCM4573_02115 [Rhizobium sp. LCM 4573]
MRSSFALVINTPLCPAGHLPLKGGDWAVAKSLINSEIHFAEPHSKVTSVWQNWCRLPISPLEGEMPGRAEGGVKQ